MKSKFWNFNQNNSGGYFVEDLENGVCEEIIVEANTKEDAWTKLQSIGDKVDRFWDYCGCCGERWSSWLSDDDGNSIPMIYDTPVENAEAGMFRTKCFVHYMDGKIQLFNHSEE